MIVFFFLENFTPNTADFLNLSKVEFKMLKMLKLGYKSFILSRETYAKEVLIEYYQKFKVNFNPASNPIELIMN